MHVIVMGQNVQHLHAIAKIISMFNPGRNSWIFLLHRQFYFLVFGRFDVILLLTEYLCRVIIFLMHKNKDLIKERVTIRYGSIG